MLEDNKIAERLIEAWAPYKNLSSPPSDNIKLASEGECVIYIENSWGPAIPYPSVNHEGEHINHGYRRVKGDNEAISEIPELLGFPEYQYFLEIMNSINSPIESVGCEKAYFPVNDHDQIKIQLSSYTDIIFSDIMLNADPINFLHLAAKFSQSLNGCDKWWSKAELGVQRLRHLYECDNPWGLMLRITGYGRDKDEARACWGQSLKCLGNGISSFQSDYLRKA